MTAIRKILSLLGYVQLVNTHNYLHIVQSKDQLSEFSKEENIIILNELLKGISDEQIENNINFLMDISECTKLNPSILELSHRSVRSRDIVMYIYVQEEINKIIKITDPDGIKAHSVTDKFKPLIQDIALSNSLDSNVSWTKIDKFRIRIKSTLLIIASFITLIFDQILAIFTTSKPYETSDSKIALIAKSGREYKLSSIAEELENKADFYTTKSLIKLVYSDIIGNRSDWNRNNNAKSLHSLSTVGVILGSLNYMIHLFVEIWWYRLMDHQISKRIRSNKNLYLNNSVSWVCDKSIYCLNIRTEVSFYYLTKELHKPRSYSKVVTGGRNRGDSGISVANDELQLETICIQNGIVQSLFRTPAIPYSKVVIGGFPGMKLWEEYLNCESNVVPYELLDVGLPEHQKFFDNRLLIDTPENKISILVLTNPQGGKSRRKKFLKDVLETAQNLGPDCEFIIRTHPSESNKFYSSVVNDNLQISESDNIKFSTSNLIEDINRADIAIVINTSAGLASAIAGTPCISYNPWHPIVPNPLYVAEGPVQRIESRESLAEFYDFITPKNINDMRREQIEWVDESYWADEASDRIVSILSKDI